MSTKGGLMFVLDTISNSQGQFIFANLPLTDTAAYTIKVHNAKGKSSTADIYIDEFKRTDPQPTFKQPLKPWNYNADSTLLKYAKARRQYALNMESVKADDVKGQLMKEVIIKEKKKLKQFGPGNFAYTIKEIDEKELITARKATLYDYLINQANGFADFGPRSFKMKGQVVMDIAIDNISVLQFFVYSGPGSHFRHLESYLRYVQADDVKKITFYRMFVAKDVVCIIDISTRSGAGPFLRSSVGTYAYRPLPLQMPRNFYRPKYLVKNSNQLPDFRSTIHWEPKVLTNANGMASFSFYAADKPGTYTLTIEGTDMAGHYGVQRRKIVVK